MLSITICLKIQQPLLHPVVRQASGNEYYYGQRLSGNVPKPPLWGKDGGSTTRYVGETWETILCSPAARRRRTRNGQPGWSEHGVQYTINGPPEKKKFITHVSPPYSWPISQSGLRHFTKEQKREQYWSECRLLYTRSPPGRRT